MIAAATRDGRTRAERIVEAAGGRLGALHYSNLGVFQITQPNSSAGFSWSGAYDTRSKRKTASVTIKLGSSGCGRPRPRRRPRSQLDQ